MSLFALAGYAIPLALHAYVWWRLVRMPRWPRWAFWTLTAILVAAYIAVPIEVELRFWAPSLAKPIGWVALPWLAFIAILAMAVFLVDALQLARRLAHRIARRPAPVDGPSRRQFLAGATTAVAGASMAKGVISARGEHEIVDVEVKLAKLPKSMDGFTIVQLSDLHVGMTIDRSFVQRVVDLANGLQPDLIALTGDIVDGPVEALSDDVAPLAGLRAKHGVYAITGNHEYYADAEGWVAHITSLGARYLRNERVTIGGDDGAFELAGVEDVSGYRYGRKTNIAKAVAHRDPSRALVLLAHQPRQARRAAELGVDLQLSGHTHGGQIWPWHYAVRMQQKGFLAGRYQVGETTLYVTRGCGYWGPPVRLFAPLEITRVVLRAA